MVHGTPARYAAGYNRRCRELRTAVLLLTVALFAGCSSRIDRYYLYADSELHRQTPPLVREVFWDNGPVRLHGWYTPATGAARGTVIHFHGNGRNLTHHSLYSQWLTGEGYNVLIFDYRGYGKSTGRASLHGLVADGVSALHQAAGLDATGRLYVFGQSLGAIVAVLALGEYQPSTVRGIILDSPISSLQRIGEEQLRRLDYPFPLYYMPYLLVPKEFDATRVISGLDPIPLLIIHGLADTVVVPGHGQELYTAAREPKKLMLLPGVGHVDGFSYHRDDIRPEVLAFLAGQANKKDEGSSY